MSMGLGHFSIGAICSLLIFRAIVYYSERFTLKHYLRWDIIIAGIGGLWAMIPDIPKLYGAMDKTFGLLFCDLFFLHCTLDTIDPNDTIFNSVILFGLFLLIINLLNLTLNNKKEN